MTAIRCAAYAFLSIWVLLFFFLSCEHSTDAAILESRHQFSLTIGKMVYFIVEKGSAVAKAGSNAQGFSYIQIGGVYTVETKRNEGYGAEVLKFLISKIIKKGKKACLFVKKDNSPAIQLYTKVGFSIRDAFRISYFH